MSYKKTSHTPQNELFKALCQAIYKVCLTQNEKALLKKFAFYHAHAEAIFPGQKALAQALEVSKRTIIRLLNSLEQKGYIVRTHKRSALKTGIYLLKEEALFKEAQKGSNVRKSAHKELLMSPQMSPKIKEVNKNIKPQVQTMSEPLPLSDVRTAEAMIQIMKEASNNVIQADLRYIHTYATLVRQLKNHWKGSLEAWTSFCVSVAQSDYLTKNDKGFTPPLLWLTKDETIEKIRQGVFHRKPKAQRSSFSGAQESTFSQKDVESWLAHDRQRRAQNISKEQNLSLQKEFEALVAQEDSWRGQNFRTGGWDSREVLTAFLHFKINAICGSFKEDLQKHLESKRSTSAPSIKKEGASQKTRQQDNVFALKQDSTKARLPLESLMETNEEVKRS